MSKLFNIALSAGLVSSLFLSTACHHNNAAEEAQWKSDERKQRMEMEEEHQMDRNKMNKQRKEMQDKHKIDRDKMKLEHDKKQMKQNKKKSW